VGILWLLFWADSVSSSNWASIFDPNDKNVTIDESLRPYIVKKYLTNSKKTIHVSLTEDQYNVTQNNMPNKPFTGFFGFKENGTYHWVVCDQYLFNSEDKLDPDSDGDLPYPQFSRVLGDVNYTKWYDEEENTYYQYNCAECNSYLGDIIEDYDALPLLRRWLWHSSALWFKNGYDEANEDEIDKLIMMHPDEKAVAELMADRKKMDEYKDGQHDDDDSCDVKFI
jgi:peptide methionine sulfoxide reductase MsrB